MEIVTAVAINICVHTIFKSFEYQGVWFWLLDCAVRLFSFIRDNQAVLQPSEDFFKHSTQSS